MPIRACWLLTSRCNYSCQFCHRILDRRELYYNEAILVADRLIRAGIKKISFSGGEPMLWTGLIELIKYIKKSGVMTMLITNASLMTEKLLENYSRVLDWITFPIDGSTEAKQAILTRRKGHLDHIISLLSKIQEDKLPLKVKINTVCSGINKDDVANIAVLIHRYAAIKRWKVFQFYPIRGFAFRNSDKFLITKDEFLLVKRRIFRKYPHWDRSSVFFATNDDLERTYFTIAPDGIVYLSYMKKDYFIGDLKQQSVQDIWGSQLYDRKGHRRQSKYLEHSVV